MNKEMLAEIIRIKTNTMGSRHQASMKLREMMVKIIDRTLARYERKFGGKFPDYVNVQVMRDYMLMFASEQWKTFDHEKSQNPVAFFTTFAVGNIYWFVSIEKCKKFPSTKDLNRSYDRAMEVL